MSEGETKDSKPSRLTDADKIRVIEWLLVQPKPLEAETWVAAAKAISEELNCKLAPAVLQNMTEASPSLRARVLIGATGGELSKLRDQVDALSERVDAIVKAYGDALKALEAKVDIGLMQSSGARQAAGTSGAYAGDALPGLEDTNGPGSDTPLGNSTGVPG